MTAQILAVIGSLLAIVIGVWQYCGRKNEESRKQAEQARKDMDNAKKEDGTASDFLDAFGRLK